VSSEPKPLGMPTEASVSPKPLDCIWLKKLLFFGSDRLLLVVDLVYLVFFFKPITTPTSNWSKPTNFDAQDVLAPLE